jgi:NADH:ubiquinone oxidoreductase subunit H
MLLMIFLAEYFHLVISSLHFILFFLGGWFSFNLWSILPPIFFSYHDTLLYSFIF